MTADSIIISVAESMGKAGLVKYLKSGVSVDVESDEREKERLLVCLNLVLGELYRTKSKMYCEQEFEADSGYIPITEFANKVLKIQSVTVKGVPSTFDILPEGIRVPQGKAVVKYAYLPQEAEAGDEIIVAPSVSERAVKCGCLAEYCLCLGMFEESARWRAEFERELSKVLKCGYVKDRRLV